MIPECEIELLAPEGSAIVHDHREHFERVARLFPAGPPDRLETFRRAAQNARERIDEETYRTLGEALRPTGPQAERKLERVIRERGVVVTTGQQAGLFTGPLYTLYKALTASRFAETLEVALGIPVLATFWIASEDHDWPEANHVHIVDRENHLSKIEVSPAGELSEKRPPLFRLSFGPDVVEAVEVLDAATPDSEFKADVLGPLTEAYRPGANVSAAFAHAFADLTRSSNLCVVEGCDPWIKTRSVPLLEREWARRREVADRLKRWTAELESMGYEAQVRLDPNSTNLFVEGPLGRERLMQDAEPGAARPGGRLRRSGVAFGENELWNLLGEDPQRVSPNVLLRPVVESSVLPVVAHVGGPSEIAYFAQLVPLFQIHDLIVPPVIARATVRLVEARVAKALQRSGLTPDALAEGAEATARRLARERMPESVESALASLRATLASGFDELGDGVVELDPTLEGAWGRARSQVERAIRELEAKITTSVQRKDEILLGQIEKAAVHLQPLGQPQERVLNVYPYLVRYGRRLMSEIAERIHVRLD